MDTALAPLLAHALCAALVLLGMGVHTLTRSWKQRRRSRRNRVLVNQMAGMRRIRLTSDDGIHWHKETDWL